MDSRLPVYRFSSCVSLHAHAQASRWYPLDSAQDRQNRQSTVERYDNICLSPEDAGVCFP